MFKDPQQRQAFFSMLKNKMAQPTMKAPVPGQMPQHLAMPLAGPPVTPNMHMNAPIAKPMGSMPINPGAVSPAPAPSFMKIKRALKPRNGL